MALRVHGHVVRNPDLSYSFWAQYFRVLAVLVDLPFSGHKDAAFSCQVIFLKILYRFFHFSDIHPESFDLQWFFSEACVAPADVTDPTANGITAGDWRTHTLHFDSKENKYRVIHFSVFLGLLLVGILELLFGLSQMVIGFLGCLCGVSKRRSRIV